MNKVRSLSVLLIALFLFLAHHNRQAIKEQKKMLHTSHSQDALSNVALGSFRSLFANYLWMKSAYYTNTERHEEAYQTAQLLCKVQPNNTPAISFQAWNMVYNISIMYQAPHERWKWIQNGVQMIRNHALKNNPQDPTLSWDLAYFFRHKIGDPLDDSHRYYKTQWAKEMTKALGVKANWQELVNIRRHSILLDQKLKRQGYPNILRLLQSQNLSLKDLKDGILPKSILTQLSESQIKAFKSFLHASAKHDQHIRTIDFILATPFSPWLKKNFNISLDDFEREFRRLGKTPLAIEHELQKKRPNELPFIDSFFRRRWLLQHYRLDPQRILAINQEYGELDWRMPESQSIYWASLSLDSPHEQLQINSHRMILVALKDSFKRGKLLHYSSDSNEVLDWTNNLTVIPTIINRYTAILTRRDELGNTVTGFLNGYRNFLIDATIALSQNGQKNQARKTYRILQKEWPDAPQFKKTLTQFVEQEFLNDILSYNPDQASSTIHAFLMKSYFFAITDQVELFNNSLRQAKLIHQRYNKFRESTGQSTKSRLSLPPFEQMQQKAKEQFFLLAPEQKGKF